ncbi:hypothetical protein ABT299_50070 [Spirillospora sp. NPDC000708]
MTAATLWDHPLSALLAHNNLTAAAYLRRVADQHRALGYGGMAVRKEKLTRWKRHPPGRSAQLAIARLHGIPPVEVDRLGWPGFLMLAFPRDGAVLESEWTPAGTLHLLTDMGGSVDLDRRGFLVVTASALAASVAQWVTAAPAVAVDDRGRRVGVEAPELFDARLHALRHLDDIVGAGQVYTAALVELRLITDLLRNASYSEEVGRRLFSCAAEAARLAGWCAYDAGRIAQAEQHFVTGLRASGSAADPTSGAVILAFWANLRYAKGDARGALHLVDSALDDHRKITSPRVTAMLHARAARAHSKAEEPTSAWRRVDAAFAAYASAPPSDEDLPSMTWITHGELHQVAASSALSLNEPRRALEHFTAAVTHTDQYDTQRETRGTAIYLARQAEAHLLLDDVDAAVDVGHKVVKLMGGVDSARATDTLDDLREGLSGHKHIPIVRNFLDYVAA